ncbi:hypothetical protein BOTBODRAFT_344914 [Botryobasidium botryosum FD-172 SS1]|uniref:Uncharacterized protein n=1 Tax=Botryobasidium botryosum (strain FD-172 SS1) TaxID=930990 RepID=A0A067MG80_BOTB1|nr:hypothetical protein BOTBODRAFT_344914 [Botryobasidium botryosum FD-172 SS1]
MRHINGDFPPLPAAFTFPLSKSPTMISPFRHTRLLRRAIANPPTPNLCTWTIVCCTGRSERRVIMRLRSLSSANGCSSHIHSGTVVIKLKAGDRGKYAIPSPECWPLATLLLHTFACTLSFVIPPGVGLPLRAVTLGLFAFLPLTPSMAMAAIEACVCNEWERL